jgi:hypothetical protein
VLLQLLPELDFVHTPLSNRLAQTHHFSRKPCVSLSAPPAALLYCLWLSSDSAAKRCFTIVCVRAWLCVVNVVSVLESISLVGLVLIAGSMASEPVAAEGVETLPFRGALHIFIVVLAVLVAVLLFCGLLVFQLRMRRARKQVTDERAKHLLMAQAELAQAESAGSAGSQPAEAKSGADASRRMSRAQSIQLERATNVLLTGQVNPSLAVQRSGPGPVSSEQQLAVMSPAASSASQDLQPSVAVSPPTHMRQTSLDASFPASESADVV